MKEIGGYAGKHVELVKKFISVKILNPQLSVRKFADREGIAHQTLDVILIKYPIIMEKILQGIRERYHQKSIDVDQALYEKATKGDPRAIELWYRKLENWSQKGEGEGGKIIEVHIDQALIAMHRRTAEPLKIVTKVGADDKPEIINAEGETPALELTGEDVDKFGEEKTDE